MEKIKIYEVDSKYISYLSMYAPHLYFDNDNKRKYIGVILQINGFDYFAPLSSFKEKHHKMKETIDFIKVKNYAVINLNNMFPVPNREREYVDIKSIKDPHYRALLNSEYRFIKSIQDKLRKNAQNLYKIKIKDRDTTKLSKRCNDFELLEKVCRMYMKGN